MKRAIFIVLVILVAALTATNIYTCRKYNSCRQINRDYQIGVGMDSVYVYDYETQIAAYSLDSLNNDLVNLIITVNQ